MGDRAIVYVKSKSLGTIGFYTHDKGSRLRKICREVIGSRTRWGEWDHSYFASILFRHLTADYHGILDGRRSWLSQIENGYGIFSVPAGKRKIELHGDAQYPPILIDLDRKLISQHAYDDVGSMSMTFEAVATEEARG